MTTPTVISDSLLAVDIGSIKTRAMLFDVIDGRYRFITSKSAATTLGLPYLDPGEGVRIALTHLSEVTGRTFLGNDGNLIMPTGSNNTGVDSFALTMSAGPPIKVVAVGLVQDVSVESACHLAEATYSSIVSKVSLDDHRSQEARIDTILKARPDLIIMAGGIEGGSSRSLEKLLEAIGLASFLLPRGHRPHILFAGNSQMQTEVNESLGGVGSLHIAANIRPTWEIETLAPAQHQLNKIFRQIRSNQSISIQELDSWTNGRLMPTSAAFERVVRVLSKVYDPSKGVLGIDLGASSSTIASAFEGKSSLGVFPHLGIGMNAPGILRQAKLEEIALWLSEYVPNEMVQDYLYNKAAFPTSLPTTIEELSIEHALVRKILQLLVKNISHSFPKTAGRSGQGVIPWFEPIMVTGNTITQAPTPGQSMMMLLDGLQPVGVTTVLLDPNSLVSALGAAAEVNPMLAVQVLGSNTVFNLGTVIAPVGNARPGTNILQVGVIYDDGRESNLEVKFGSLEVIPLPMREAATLRLQPLHRFDVGMGPGRGGKVQVVGGSLGVVIDTRGRPLNLSSDPELRREKMKEWLWKLEN